MAWALTKKLQEFDRLYVWQTLTIVAVEDIGVADLSLVRDTLIAQQVTVRSKVDQDALLAALVWRLASAMKSQAAVELAFASELEGKSLYEMAAKMNTEDLVDIVMLGGLQASHVALCVLRGKVPRDVTVKRPVDRAGLATLDAKLSSGSTCLKPEQVESVRYATAKASDAMHLALLSLLLHWEAGELGLGAVSVPDELPPSILVNGVPGEAYDMHCAVGKIVMKAFHTSLTKVFQQLKEIQKEDAIGAMGSLVFMEEGGLLDRRLTSPKLKELRDWQCFEFATKRGVPVELYAEARGIVKNEMKRLNQKRMWAVGL